MNLKPTTQNCVAAINGLAGLLGSAEPQPITAEDLRWSAVVAQQLTDRGIDIMTAYHNGRGMVLHVNRDPHYGGLRGSMIRRQPVPGGYERIYAVRHLGVQVQWAQFQATASEVANG
jgi:hypothetical protein